MVLDVNGVKHQITADPDVALLNVLRNHLDLTGSKYGCGEGALVYGACTVAGSMGNLRMHASLL